MSPDYFHKLATQPQFPVISVDPPAWIIAENFGTGDYALTMPMYMLTGPAFALAVARMRGNKSPSAWTVPFFSLLARCSLTLL